MASIAEQFADLQAKKAAIEKDLAPLRAKQSELHGKIAPLNVELVAVNKAIKDKIASSGLYELDMAIGQCARALGGKTLKASGA